MKDYIAQALQTMAPSIHPERAHLGNLVECLSEVSMWTQNLDLIKKGLFYNRKHEQLEPDDNNINKASYALVLQNISNDEAKAIAILHGIIGKITEVGELADALLDVIKHPKKLDVINVREEVGDGLWYDAILLDAIGSSFEDAMRVNIAKLRARFPNKFTEYDALNRDLTAERKELEA